MSKLKHDMKCATGNRKKDWCFKCLRLPYYAKEIKLKKPMKYKGKVMRFYGLDMTTLIFNPINNEFYIDRIHHLKNIRDQIRERVTLQQKEMYGLYTFLKNLYK